MKQILAISAGQKFSKKGDSIVRQKQKYLNFGLLGLASLIKKNSQREIMMFQADNYSPLELINRIEESGICLLGRCEYILLSIPSYHSISWCVEFCELIHKFYALKIIVGGRWVVDGCSDWIKKRLKYVDIVSEGFGEKFIFDFFGMKGRCGDSLDGCHSCFSEIDYTVLYNYSDYNPNIEISRGCGFGCNFCADKNHHRLPNKSVGVLMRELEYLDALYGRYTPYYTAPHFVFEKNWLVDYMRSLRNRDTIINWRCTTRVESIPIMDLANWRKIGLKIIDVGLESASPKQLMRMHKTMNPEQYLNRAREMLKACYENNIWVKLNVMLYAGETLETIRETEDWLQSNKVYIKDVSAGPLVYYRNMDNLDELKHFGASIPEDQDLAANGYAFLNLSAEVDKAFAIKKCIDIPRIVATQKDFFDVKSFSYYPSSYTYSAFVKDVKKCNPQDLPFKITV